MDLPSIPPTAVSDRASPTNSSSEPSPQAADATRKAQRVTRIKDRALGLRHEDRPQREKAANHAIDHFEARRQILLRRSTGSIAIMTHQQETVDIRRHTFSVRPSDSRASMRRRSCDLTAQFCHTYPPLSPSRPYSLHAHQHLRVYGKSTGPVKHMSACHEEGLPFVAFVAPYLVTVWTRGTPVVIEWKVLDATVDKVCIELREDGLSATTLIAKDAPNTGVFTYPKVPWGMESGSKYFVRVSTAADSERYCTSSFFQISSGP